MYFSSHKHPPNPRLIPIIQVSIKGKILHTFPLSNPIKTRARDKILHIFPLSNPIKTRSRDTPLLFFLFLSNWQQHRPQLATLLQPLTPAQAAGTRTPPPPPCLWLLAPGGESSRQQENGLQPGASQPFSNLSGLTW